MATVYFSGYLFADNGTALSGASIDLLEAGTTTVEGSTTTDSNGFWSFNETDDDKYDVKISMSGSNQIRYRKWADEISVKMLDVRNNEGEGVPAATFTNFADGDDMEIVHYRGLRGTGAADDNLFFRYYMDDAGGNITEMANMAVNLVDATANSEDVKIIWQIKAGASMVDALTISSTSGAVVSTSFNQNALTFGTGADTDITLTFNANTADGLITWMEDEDYFKFSDEILMNSTEKILFGDTGTFIHQSSDGVLTITSDTTVDINGAVAFDGAITGATNITLSGELDAATLDLSSSADIAGDLVLSGGADGALQFTNAGENSIKIPDNQASALIIEEANNAYITFVTTDSSEAITVAKATTFSAGIANAGTIAAGTWNGTKIATGYIADNAITNALMADDAIDSAEIANGAVDNAHLADDAVGADELAANAVVNASVASGAAIDVSKLALTAGDGLTLNTNDMDLDAALTTVTSIYNASLKMGRDSQNLIDFATTDNKIILRVNNVDEVELVANVLEPVTNDGVALGTTSLGWSDLHLATGAVINWADGEMSITEGDANTLTVAGGTFATAALTTSTIVASGIIKTDDTTNATSTTDGSLQTDGGLSVALDAIFGDDVTLITDSAVLNLGVGSDVSITHDGTTGGTITGTPMVYESKGSASLANDTHSGVVLEMLAGESLAVGDWVYVDSTDARVSKADANDTGDNGHYPAIGVAVSAQGSAGSAVKILTHGTYNDSDGFGGDLTEGNLLYLSETAGGITATAPSDDGDMVQVVGVAIGPRDVLVNPSLVVVEIA